MKKYPVLLLAVVLILAIILPSPVLAKGPDKDSGVKDALIQGADHMLAVRGTFPEYDLNGNLIGNVPNTWEWQIGTG